MSVHCEKLEAHLKALSADAPEVRVCVLLSGGVDSSVVAAAALAALPGRVRALTVRSEFMAAHDAQWALRIAEHLRLPHRTLAVRLLADPGIRAHENDRCYRCKSAICRAAHAAEPEALLLDGTNVNDDPHRPGRRALREQGVLSPLEACGLGKAEVCELAEEYGLPNAHRPSNSCLATRLPPGRPILAEDLAKVSRLEDVLREAGFDDVRARLGERKVVVEIPRGSEALLETAHAGLMRTVVGLGLQFAGYAYRKTPRGSRGKGEHV